MISVVIPVLDEEGELGAALAAVAEQDAAHETVVADGGSRDRTREVAEKHGARVVVSERGRARQMNAGAALAGGDVLLFLHADTRLPAGGLAAVARVMAATDAPGGGFLKRYDRGGRFLRLAERILNDWRTRRRHRLVGTQAMFVRRELFERWGGFPDWPFLEDVELSDRLRRAGRPAVVPLAVTASARRYRQRGEVRQIAVNGIIMVLYRLGVSVGSLRQLYEGLR